MYSKYNSCIRKVRFQTERQALSTLGNIKDDIPKPLHVYYCEHCYGYHIGGYEDPNKDAYKNDIEINGQVFKFKTYRDDPESAKKYIDFLEQKGYITHVKTIKQHDGARGRPKRHKRYRIYVRKDNERGTL